MSKATISSKEIINPEKSAHISELFNDARNAIENHWAKNNGSPGKPIAEIEKIQSGFRMKYEQGAIYCKLGQPSSLAWVHGAIFDKYESLGEVNSWLGFPLTDETEFPEGGKVTTFESGDIIWWPDTGAIPMGDIAIRYSGLSCVKESGNDQMSNSDEPYVVMGLISPFGNTSEKTKIYNDVDSKELRKDNILLYSGKPYGATLSMILMENDYGNPDVYLNAMRASVSAAFTGISALTVLIPVVGAIIASIVGPILSALSPTVSSELNELLNTQDDLIGSQDYYFSPKELVKLASGGQISDQQGIRFNKLISGFHGGGTNYQLFFIVEKA